MYRVDVFVENKQKKERSFKFSDLNYNHLIHLKFQMQLKIRYIPSTISRAVIKRKKDYLSSSSANANFEGEKRREFIFLTLFYGGGRADICNLKDTAKECIKWKYLFCM